MRRRTPIPIRARLDFFSRRDPGGCLLWCGSTVKGYGRMKIGGRNIIAHRAAWAEVHGPIPDGLLVCHRCDVRACVNVDHLFLGTASDNMRDMTAKGRRFRPDNAGEKNGSAKLTSDAVREIRADRRTYRELSAVYGVAPSTVFRAKTGASFR